MSDCLSDVREAQLDFVVAAVEELSALLGRAQAIDLRAAEPDKSETAHDSLLRSILPLLTEAQDITSRVAGHFEEDGDGARADLADIATMAGIALQERRALLAHGQPCDHWIFIESCERSLRCVVKSASAMEAALRRYRRLPMRECLAGELAVALSVRRRYGALRREVSGVRAEDVAARLQAASRSIATLLNCDDYQSMRLGDRRELRMLQYRIQSWLSIVHPPAGAGEHLWEEVIAVASLICGVNKRSELVSHDAAAVSALLDVLLRKGDVRELQDAAAPLLGLDVELDDLLDLSHGGAEERQRWDVVVSRLAQERCK